MDRQAVMNAAPPLPAGALMSQSVSYTGANGYPRSVKLDLLLNARDE